MADLHAIYTRLREHFGPLSGPDARRPWWPIYSAEPQFEVIVGAVLVQQTRWETVEAAVLRLIGAGLLTPGALAVADVAVLAALIRPAAFHTQKAPGLIAIARHIVAHYGGSVAALLERPTAELRTELLALPRIGPETCDVILLYGGGHPVFVVDEYTRRLFERVFLHVEHARRSIERPAAGLWRSSYEQLRLAIEAELTEEGPLAHQSSARAQLYAEFHAQINEECVRYCLATPRCDGPPARRVYSMQEGRENYLASDAGCPLRSICGYYALERGERGTRRS